MISAELIGRHPQKVSYYMRLVAGTFRSMLDVGMLATGSALVGLAVTLILDAFDLVQVGLGLRTSGLLGSGLVVGVVGAFALGIASEGGYGAPESVRSYPLLEVMIGRMLGSLAISLLLLMAHARLEPLVADLSLPIRAAEGLLGAAGSAGAVVVTLLGVPAAFGVRRGLDRLGWGEEFELPILYVVWVLGLLANYQLPSG